MTIIDVGIAVVSVNILEYVEHIYNIVRFDTMKYYGGEHRTVDLSVRETTRSCHETTMYLDQSVIVKY